MTREQIIAAAKDAGFTYWELVSDASQDKVIRLYEAGRMAEREECISIVESYEVSVGNSRAGELACEWTMENLREIRDAIRARSTKAP